MYEDLRVFHEEVTSLKYQHGTYLDRAACNSMVLFIAFGMRLRLVFTFAGT